MAAALLISDLHLPNTASPLRHGFLNFLSGPARSAGAVYILGDLFEYWIGDAEGLQDYAPEAAALRALTATGVPVYVMAGNRDFLLGRRFAAATGVTLLNDPTQHTLGGVETLLAHGDRYCTDDRGYQRWRWWSRQRWLQMLYANFPVRWRRGIAGYARGNEAPAKTPKMIYDVTDEGIALAFTGATANRLIHGHTHRPGHHRLQLNGREVERWVLPDWREPPYPFVEIAASNPTPHTRYLAPTE